MGKEEKRSRQDKDDEREAQQEKEKHQDNRISEVGQLTLNENEAHHKIHLITIIGEIEGHDNLGSGSKTTKYEHILHRQKTILFPAVSH